MDSLLMLLNKKGGNGGAVEPIAPLDAPDSDFLQWIDFSDNARLNIATTSIIQAHTGKVVGVPANSYYDQGSSSAPKNTGVINSLQAAEFNAGQLRRLTEDNSFPDNNSFDYPSFCIFTVIRIINVTYLFQDFMSDYGLGSSLFLFRIGDGTNMRVETWLRDASSEVIKADSGTTYLSQDVDYLLVSRFDGANKRVDLWIDGGTTYTATNASYDNTQVFTGGSTKAAYIGELANNIGINPIKAYVGSIFVAKTALSNNDINAYAGWMAEKWGITWNQII